MWAPQEAKERIASRSLLADRTFHDVNLDALLNARDDSFADDWVRAFNEVEGLWRKSPDNAIHTPAIDAVREIAFKRTVEACGAPDLSAQVSDDFELICRRHLLGIESPFIVGMQKAYDAQQIPR